MKIALQPIEALVPYARNARTHSDAQIAQLAASMVEFGFTNPVLADAQGIVAGHGRVLAARQLYEAGQTLVAAGGAPIPKGKIPVIDCSGWSEAKRRAYILADNRLALSAGWDEQMLFNELLDLRSEDYDLELTGFDDKELADIFAEIDDADLPQLSAEDRPDFQQMTFTLHDTQAEVVAAALAKAKEAGPFDGPNENSNGNALHRIAQAYMGSGNGRG